MAVRGWKIELIERPNRNWLERQIPT